VRPPGRRDHQEVLRFLKDGDVEGAAKWLQEHLDRVASELVMLMEQDDAPEAGAK
jgi:DNA-binding GntR family transcriptional regulator